MSLTSVLARARAFVEAREERDKLARFRAVFAWIWVVYDVLDLTLAGTERGLEAFGGHRDLRLVAVQIGLILFGSAFATGRWLYAAGMATAALRFFEARFLYGLNDFFFVAVVTLILAHANGGPLGNGRPRWVRAVLLAQIGWVYFATAALKLSPAWLDGGEIFVRTMTLDRFHRWPFPPAVASAFGSLAFDAALAKIAVFGEFGLALVFWLRRPYALGVLLALGVHGFGAFAANVWFFGATMIAAAVLLVPRAGEDAPNRSAPAEGRAARTIVRDANAGSTVDQAPP